MHGEGSVLCPVREAGAAGAQRACERAQPRRAAISTFRIAPPRNSTHFGTSHAPRKSLEAALGNAWSSSSLVATGRTGNSNLTWRSLLDTTVVGVAPRSAPWRAAGACDALLACAPLVYSINKSLYESAEIVRTPRLPVPRYRGRYIPGYRRRYS
eukprot:COSAG03_NODE_22_length_20538_cov_27.667286_18_plen_155_part_00